MTCSVSRGFPSILCPRAMASAAVLAAALLGVPQGVAGTKAWVAGSLNVEPATYSWGQLISLKGAVENGDPFRATRIMVEAGQRPDPAVWRPALLELNDPYLGV